MAWLDCIADNHFQEESHQATPGAGLLVKKLVKKQMLVEKLGTFFEKAGAFLEKLGVFLEKIGALSEKLRIQARGRNHRKWDRAERGRRTITHD